MFGEELKQVDRVFVQRGARKLVYFGGCDYLRMASDPRVLHAVAAGLKRHGLNVAASRKTTGNHPIYRELERSIARFFGVERALLVSSGYLTNLAVAQGLAGTIERLHMDERAHSSLKDAARLLGARITTFKQGELPRAGPRDAIMTDGVFAHDGSLPHLGDYRAASPGALLWIDDSHGAGVLGVKGRGSVELAGLSGERLVTTITFSKAFGVYGGAVLGPAKLIEQIADGSGIVRGNTPLPPPLAAGVMESVRIVREGKNRMRLARNLELFQRATGQGSGGSPAPIRAVAPRTRAARESLRRALLKQGVHPPLIDYPGGPKGGFFRFALSSEHTSEQIETLGHCLADYF